MEELKQLVTKLGLEMSVLSAPFSPTMPENMFHWVCCISKGASIMNTPFSTGGGLLKVQDKIRVPFFQNITANDVQRAKKEIGSVYYDFKRKHFAKHGRTSLFDAQLYACVFEAKPPTIEDVLMCLAMDASVLDYSTFEDWASDFGYDTDSRNAEKIYKACLEGTLRLRNFIGEDNLKAIREMEF